MAELAGKNGVYTYLGFLSKESINAALERGGKAKLIFGNNVFNHIHNPNEIIPIARDVLKDGGYFVFESPYHKDIIENFLFDTVYHEHISYFSVRSADFLFRKNRLYITNIEHNNYHGGSIRVYASKNESEYNKEIVDEYINKEHAAKLFSLDIYKNFMSKITKDKFEVLSQIYQLKKEGKRIAAIGAASKGNTLLNFYKLDNGVIDFITETSEFKIGKYTPGSCIPIVHDDELTRQNVDVALIISWNIGRYLVDKIKKINDKIRFIVPGEKGLL